MTNSKILPIGFMTVMLTLSGAAIATGQNGFLSSSETTAAAAAQVPAMQFRAEHRSLNERRVSVKALFCNANGNRTITNDDVNLAVSALAASADATGKAGISLEEYQAIFIDLMRDCMAESFQSLDVDGNGEVTAEEVDATIARIVGPMERKGDDLINVGEERGGDRT